MATRHKHRASVRIFEQDLEAESPWFQIEFLHPNPDRRSALMGYLRDQFTDRRAVSETMDGTFLVVDPAQQPEPVLREYRVN